MTYGLCSRCRLWYALRADGTVRWHKAPARGGAVSCAGWAREPDETSGGAG